MTMLPNDQSTPPSVDPAPAPGAESPQQPFVYTAGTPVPTSRRPRLPKKPIIIGGAIVVAVGLVVGGFFGLKSWSDTAATTYARAIDTHLDRIFDKPTRTERLVIIKEDRAQLQPIFLGELVSQRYKNASENLAPLYNDTLDKAEVATQAARDSNESLSTFLRNVQAALAAGTPKDFQDKNDFDTEYIAQSIEGSLKVADELDAAADTLEQATTLKDLPSYQKAIDATHQWADTRREIAVYSATWVEDVVNWASAGLEEVNKNLQNLSSDYDSTDFDNAGYQAKMDELLAQYKTDSNAAVDVFSDLVDEKLAAGIDAKTQTLLDTANAKLTELEKRLEDFLPREEIYDK